MPLSPDEQQQAIKRAIQAVQDRMAGANAGQSLGRAVSAPAAPGYGPKNTPQAPVPTPNPNLPMPSNDPSQTMQSNPQNIKNALSGKALQDQMDEINKQSK